MRLTTYNTRGLPKSRRDLHRRPDITKVFENNDIVCLQETWFATQDLKMINSLHEDFHGVGSATVNYDSDIFMGHPPGGVATLWRRELGSIVKSIDLNVNWCTGIEIKSGTKNFAIFNVYMPYQCAENYDEYLEKLGVLGAIIAELDHTCFGIVGDWNANPVDSGNSLFGDLLHNFANDQDLIVSTGQLLPQNSYTFVSSAWGSTSWIDHILSSEDFHNTLSRAKINYDYSDDDHIPVSVLLDINCVPECDEYNNDMTSNRLSWDRLTKEEAFLYPKKTDDGLRTLVQPKQAFSCRDINCTNELHIEEISNFYNGVVNILIKSGEAVLSCARNKKYAPKPGWADYVSDIYEVSREARKQWLLSGKPRLGFIHETYVKSKARFKYALRYIKRNEAKMRQDSLARKMSQLDQVDFWKEIKVINNSRTSLPLSVDDSRGARDIAAMWKVHFQNLFNCIERHDVHDFHCTETELDSAIVGEEEVKDAIKELSLGKSCGLDGIYAEHLKFSSDIVVSMLSKCFSGFFVHGFLPDALLSVVLVPIIKDKSAKVSSKENYRPIAVASVLSKVFEKVILLRIEKYISTNCNQFGFKRRHGTDQCIYLLKELVDCYRTLNGTMFVGFLDASKAFDRVNHNVLFNKLFERGVPPFIVRVLVYWYAHQTFCVRWGSIYSEPFTVSNGVRQGGILSPLFFNLYMDDLSSKLNKCRVGCCFDNRVINHLMYADDLVVFAPSVVAINKLLRICDDFAYENDVKFNTRKSAVMVFRPKSRNNVQIKPRIYLNDVLLETVDSYKYLGHCFTNDLMDNADIKRQSAKLYIQGNTILRKFYMCTMDVKLALFRSFCMPMYTTYLWWNFNKTVMNKLYISYHNIFKMFLGFSKFESTSLLCTVFDIQCCAAVIRNHIYSFICRLDRSPNRLIKSVLETSLKFTSNIRRFWYAQLYKHDLL